jgi:hypothetical protein
VRGRKIHIPQHNSGILESNLNGDEDKNYVDQHSLSLVGEMASLSKNRNPYLAAKTLAHSYTGALLVPSYLEMSRPVEMASVRG